MPRQSSHAKYPATMAPMVLRSSSPASSASPNAHSSEQVRATPSTTNCGGCVLMLIWSSGDHDQATTAVTAAPNTTSPRDDQPELGDEPARARHRLAPGQLPGAAL